MRADCRLFECALLAAVKWMCYRMYTSLLQAPSSRKLSLEGEQPLSLPNRLEAHDVRAQQSSGLSIPKVHTAGWRPAARGRVCKGVIPACSEGRSAHIGSAALALHGEHVPVGGQSHHRRVQRRVLPQQHAQHTAEDGGAAAGLHHWVWRGQAAGHGQTGRRCEAAMCQAAHTQNMAGPHPPTPTQCITMGHNTHCRNAAVALSLHQAVSPYLVHAILPH